MLFIGGIFDKWRNENNIIYSFSIVVIIIYNKKTIEPSKNFIHDRLPVILLSNDDTFNCNFFYFDP
jgi:hypothetical protein